MASSSSGLGRRPLKAEIVGSNPIEATKFSACNFGCRFFYFIYPTDFSYNNSALEPFWLLEPFQAPPRTAHIGEQQTSQARFPPYSPLFTSPTSVDFPMMRAPRPSHPAHSTTKKPSLGDRKQKIDPDCNFFAIADCCGTTERQ